MLLAVCYVNVFLLSCSKKLKFFFNEFWILYHTSNFTLKFFLISLDFFFWYIFCFILTFKYVIRLEFVLVSGMIYQNISWRRKWQPTPVFLPGKSHGQRSLVGYNLWGLKESDVTERPHMCVYKMYGSNLELSRWLPSRCHTVY